MLEASCTGLETEMQENDDQWKEFSSLPPGNQEGPGET